MADTGIFAWLDRASRCGDVDVERSAEMLKNYYQGIGPEPEYQEVGQSNDRQMTVKQDSDGWPGEIYLQAGDDPLSHFSEYDEVSWCDHPQGESDVRYVRADEPIAALAPRPAEVGDEGLPPLPDHIEVGGEGWDIEDFKSEKTFTVEHMWQYARDAVATDRARRDQEIADLRFNIGELMKAVAPSHTTNKEK